jgi:predicted PurR-regulated permease PerM
VQHHSQTTKQIYMALTLTQRRSISWLAIGLVAALFVWLLAPVLTPFVVGAVMAYALHPMVERLVRMRCPRIVAVGVVEVIALLVLLAVVLLIVPIMSKEIPLLKAQIPVLADRMNHSVSPWLAQFGVQMTFDGASIKAFVLKYLNANLEDWFSTLLSSAQIGGSVALALVGNLFMIPVVVFYLLLSWPTLIERITHLIPPRLLPSVSSFVGECDSMLGQYVRGQILVMLILAVFYSVGLWLFGFDLALPVGVFTGLAICVPYVGFGIGLILALFAGLLQFASLHALIAVGVVYGVGQTLEALLLTPRLVGERIGLNPLMVIFALLAFGQLFGFIGVLIALPVSALLVVAVRRVRATYLGSPLYLGS